MPVNTGLAQLSVDLLSVVILIYTIAMFLYALEYAFGRKGRIATSAAAAAAPVLVGAGGPEQAAAGAAAARAGVVAAGSTAAGGLAGPAGATSVGRPVPPQRLPDDPAGPPPDGDRPSRMAFVGRAAVALTVVGLAVHVAVLVTRGMSVHRVPWGNMYEFALAVSLVAVAGYLILLTRAPVRYLGGFVMVPVVLLLGLAGTVLYTKAAPLVPALNSYWIKIHVTAAVTASGVFLIGFVLSVLYLIRDRYERRVGAGHGVRFPITLGVRLPAAEALERVSFRTIAFAFPIWTFAIMAGAIWAEAAWGRYWGWDPKETWSFIAWVIYAAYLHARATAGWRGRRASYIAVLGWAAMMFNLFAVNTVIAGLHSYAGLN